MDRQVKIYSKKGYLVAELSFYYDKTNQVSCAIAEHRMYQSEDYETGEPVYYTYPAGNQHINYINFIQFKTLDELKQYDRNFAKKELRYNTIENFSEYDFVYGPDLQQRRYFIGTHYNNTILGVADFKYNFDTNTKDMVFLSGNGLKWDQTLDSDCLVTNMNLFGKMFFSEDWEQEWKRSPYDITMIDSW